MISILQAEFFRLKKSKTYWIIFIVNAALSILGCLLLLAVEAFFKALGEGSFLEILGLSLSATAMLFEFAQFSTDSALLALICSAIFLSREFTQGTVRNAVLANKNRTQLFLSYYIVALVIGTSYFFTSFVLNLAMYGAVLGFGSETAAQSVNNVFIYFALGLCSVIFVQTCVCMFLFTTRRQSLTIILPILVCMLAPSLITSIIDLILSAATYAGNVISNQALECIPIYNMSTLNPNDPSGLNVGMIALYDLIFAGGLFAAGFFPFQKADLK